MANRVKTRKQMQKMEQNLTKVCHFNKTEVKDLLELFYFKCSDCEQKFFDRPKMQDILQHEFELTDEILPDRVFRAFDLDSDSKLSPEEWVKGMSVYLRGNIKEKTNFCFMVYDLNGDGVISKEEVFHLLKTSLEPTQNDEDADDGVRDLVEQALKKLDVDNDGHISPDDFCRAVEEDNLLLESLGICLPKQSKSDGFLKKLPFPESFQ